MPDDPRSEIDRAREEARRAREEADRLRSEARDLQRRLRSEAHDERRRAHDAARDARHAAAFERHWQGTGRADDAPSGAEARESLDFTGVAHLAVDQSAGKLTIRRCAEGEAPEVVASSNKTPPQLSVRKDGDRLTISIKQQAGWLFRRRAGANALIRVPGAFQSARINMGYGDLQLRELASDRLDLDVGAGTIQTYSCRGNLHANVGAGRIGLHDHAGLVTAETGTGDLQVDIEEMAPGEYRASTGIGRAEFSLPAGQSVHIKASSGIGRARIEYPSAAEGAPMRVRIDTGVGEATVRERRADKERARPPAPPPRAPGFAPQRAARRKESEEFRVLQLLEQGKISSQEAAELLAALQGAPPPLDDDYVDPPDQA